MILDFVDRTKLDDVFSDDSEPEEDDTISTSFNDEFENEIESIQK